MSQQINNTRVWYQEQIQQYREAQPHYKQMAQALQAILQQAANERGLLSIVQARAKTISSFAEKIQRPGKSYRDPVRELTDLCGARVIVHNLRDVAAMCQFVEKHFKVFYEHSGNKLESLEAKEFGYLSQHYIVRFEQMVFPEALVPQSLLDLGLRAEIQVRTILQHAWADIYHELSYKSSFKLPRRWEREFARLAAVLEQADQSFEQIREGLELYSSSYDTYYTPEQLKAEIEKLAIILEAEGDNVKTAHRMARMAISLGDWGKVLETLSPLADKAPAHVLRDLGISICKLHRKEPEGQEFAMGQEYLQQAVEKNPRDTDALAALAGTYRTQENSASTSEQRATHREMARRYYCRAFEVDPTDPYPLGNYIEYEVADNPNVDVVSHFRLSVEAASRKCQAQADVKMNLPWAFFDLGKFKLLLKEPFAALCYYAKGVYSSGAAFFLDSALSSFRNLEAGRQRIPGFSWSRSFLEVARSIRFPAAAADATNNIPVIIVAGDNALQASEANRKLLIDAFNGFPCLVISGGTNTGISALVGELQTQTASPDAMQSIGYTPAKLPEGMELDSRYTEHRRSEGNDFSPLEALSYWV